MQRQRVKSEKCQTWTAKFCTNCIVPLKKTISFFLFLFLWNSVMPRHAQCKFSRVWHPNIPEFCPTLRLDWCRKQGWVQENRSAHLILFSFPIQVKFITVLITFQTVCGCPSLESQPSDLFRN